LASRESNFGLALSPVFRSLSLTAEFDFGLFHLKSALKRRNTLLPDFCTKFARFVANNWSFLIIVALNIFYLFVAA
jgi:hypothetical protein